ARKNRRFSPFSKAGADAHSPPAGDGRHRAIRFDAAQPRCFSPGNHYQARRRPVAASCFAHCRASHRTTARRFLESAAYVWNHFAETIMSTITAALALDGDARAMIESLAAHAAVTEIVLLAREA